MIPSFTSAGSQGRRAALQRLMAFLLAGAAGSITVGYGKENENKGAVCVNLSALSPGETKRRKLENYTEKSSDPGKTCSGCTFFTRGVKAAACGQCQIFNGPANPNGRCDDWTARPA
jgi:hypothetical protein